MVTWLLDVVLGWRSVLDNWKAIGRPTRISPTVQLNAHTRGWNKRSLFRHKSLLICHSSTYKYICLLLLGNDETCDMRVGRSGNKVDKSKQKLIYLIKRFNSAKHNKLSINPVPYGFIVTQNIVGCTGPWAC